MFLFSKEKITVFTIMLIILTGCGGGSAQTPTDNSVLISTVEVADSMSSQTLAQTPIMISTDKAIQSGKVTDRLTGEPLVDVEVSIGTHTTTTDEEGYYELQNIDENDKTIITFKHEGYYRNSEIIALKKYSNRTSLSPNYLEFSLDSYDYKKEGDSQNEMLFGENFSIQIPANIYIDEKGNDYNGNIVVSVSYEDVSTEKGKDAFPGLFEGRNSNNIIVPFISYGFMVIDLKDEVGTNLSISDAIVLTFHTAIEAISDIVPLWYYDYEQGIWIEEGYATRLENGKYEGTVSHPGTWSLSQPVEDALGIYTDRILYPDGTPVKNMRVHAIGKNWISTDLSTDEYGIFEIEVIPNEEFALEAYHYRDGYSAKFSDTIEAVSPGDIVGEIN